MLPLSVVVPVYNAERTLEACIAALEAQDYPTDQREFILVDNNSTDRSAAIIQAHAGVRYLLETRQGPAAARNAGGAAAQHPVLVFTDSDCIPERDWLSTLARALEEENLDVAGGEIIPASLSRYVERQMWRQGFLVQQRMILREDPFPFCISANLAIRKATFEALGGFSLDYPLASGEDLALGYALSARGGRFGYVPAAQGRHHHRTSYRDLYRQFVRYGEGSAQFYRLNAARFTAEKVRQETTGRWTRQRDAYEWARIAKHWCLRTPGKHDKQARRWEEILFDYCVARGWQMGKAAGETPKLAHGQARRPVLAMMLTPCCWREYYVPFTKLGKQLERRDYDVHYLAGHGGDCTFMGSLEGWNDDKCEQQFAMLDREVAKPGAYAVLGTYITEAMRDTARRFIETHRDTPYATLEFGGLNVWEVVRGSVCRELRERFLLRDTDNLSTHPLLEKYARTMVTGYLALEAYLDDVQPDAAMVFNGFFYQERLLSELARRRGCKVVAHENSCFRDRKIFSETGYVGNWTDPNAEGRFRLRARVLTNEQRQQVRNYLDGVFSGKVNTIGQAAPDTEAAVREKLHVAPGQKIALLIGQVPFDVVMVYDLGVFENMLGFIEGTIEFFRQRPDYTLVVRLHPFEEVIGGDRTWKQLQEQTLPDNVRVVHSKDINTYSIMRIADFGIASTSQAALEMAAMNKPVALVGEAFFGRHGFTCDIDDVGGFSRTLQQLCDAPHFTPAMQNAMERFLYHIIFEHQVPYHREAWQFSGAAANQIAGMIGLTRPGFMSEAETCIVGAEGFTTLLHVPNGHTPADGFTPLHAQVNAQSNGDGNPWLACATDATGWSGVGYGCAQANQCDGRTLPCAPQRAYTASVSLRALDEVSTVPVQLHAIGTNGGNFGSQRITLGTDWKTVTLRFQTAADTTHLGLQIVKAGQSTPVRFALRDLKVAGEFSWLNLV